MALRIEEQVVRGEIDNRTRGCVTGRIWFAGRAGPVELDLAGNAWRDLAGRRLEFVNPEPKPGGLSDLATRQSGVIGDCTASRKVKVPDIPLEQIGEYYEAGKPFPWHWGNSLYFEWFSPANGRVVIESAAYQLTVGPDMTWEMSEAGEEDQRRANAEAMQGFMRELGEATAADSATWDEPKPHSEAELRIRHPLAEQAATLRVRLMREPEARGWIPESASAEHPVVEVMNCVMSASAKFAGALNGQTWPPEVIFCGHTIVRLKRARGYLDDALRAADACVVENLVDAAWLAPVRREIEVLSGGCDTLIKELREKLERGFD